MIGLRMVYIPSYLTLFDIPFTVLGIYQVPQSLKFGHYISKFVQFQRKYVLVQKRYNRWQHYTLGLNLVDIADCEWQGENYLFELQNGRN